MRKSSLKAFVTLFAMLTVLGCGSALADTPKIREESIVIGENRVVYPQLEGLEDEAIQKAINDDIVMRGDITGHLVTLSTLQEGGWGLTVDYEAYLQNNVLSITLGAKGEVTRGREGQTYTALCYDLETGLSLKAEDLFADLPAAVAFMEEEATRTMTDELSGYLENTDLAPLPVDNFVLDADGITFYYPMTQFQLLSGYSGACQFYYEEITDFLDWDGVVGGLGVQPQEYTDAEARERIARQVESGGLPHVPVKIGDNVKEASAKYRLLREPDGYPGGKYYQMETPMFRQVLVLAGELSRSDENAPVTGLQTMRGSLFGIQAGKTTRDEWRRILGDPESTVVFDENLAYDYSIPQGESDFYTYGKFQLRLHADADGILHNIRISQ